MKGVKSGYNRGSNVHFKAGGTIGRAPSGSRTRVTTPGEFKGLPPKARNPFREARQLTNRTIGPSKARKEY